MCTIGRYYPRDEHLVRHTKRCTDVLDKLLTKLQHSNLQMNSKVNLPTKSGNLIIAKVSQLTCSKPPGWLLFLSLFTPRALFLLSAAMDLHTYDIDIEHQQLGSSATNVMAFLWAAGRGRVGGVLYDSKSAATTMGYPIEDSIGGGLPLYHQRIISRVQEAFPKHCGRPTLPKFRSQPSDEMERQMIRKKEGAEKRICRRPTSWLETIHHGGNRASLFAFALVALYHHCSSPQWVSGDLYARQYGVGCFG